MSTEFITTENLSRDLLKSIFDAAFIETTLDSEGDIVVQDQCKVIVIPDKERRRIWLLTQYAFKPNAKESQKMTCVNNINKDYIMARAVVLDNILRFTYDIILDGDGITKKSFVMVVKRFGMIPPQAVADYGGDIVL